METYIKKVGCNIVTSIIIFLDGTYSANCSMCVLVTAWRVEPSFSMYALEASRGNMAESAPFMYRVT